jgi:hypothetical protein
VAGLAGAVLGLGAGTALADGVPPGVVQGGGGALAPEAGVRYVTMAGDGRTVLAEVRTGGGQVRRWTFLPGSLGVPMITLGGATGGLSADGGTLVLEQVRTGLPVRARSRLVVVRTRTLRPAARISLRGDFSFDALSPDGRTLYLIEHRARGDASRYRVRAYDVPARRLLPGVIRDEDDPPSGMSGYPMARAEGPGGRWVFTLYQNPRGAPFVHALDTVRRAAECIDLPWSARDDVSGLRMVIDGHGSLAIVRERAVRVALIDGGTFAVRAAASPRGEL